MAEIQGSPVPVLDLSLRCGQKLLDVSLWREEALCELYLGDEVELTHLKVFVWDSGNGKMNSSNYTTVKVHNAKHISCFSRTGDAQYWIFANIQHFSTNFGR
ncbi:hypothetical protein PO909_029480 [Leuciscus waleckii]